MKNKSSMIKKVLYALFIILCSTLIFGSLFVKKIYPNVRFEELIFYLFNGVESTDDTLIVMGAKYSLPLIAFLSIILYILLDNLYISGFILKKFDKVKYKGVVRIILSLILLFTSIIILMSNLNVFIYIENQNKVSSFIEKNYVNPKNVDIAFPEKKRNLIIIFVESLETTMFTKNQGGYWGYEVVPELYDLLNDEDTTVFYDNNKTELMKQLDLSSWTTGGDVANTSGLPLKIPIQRNSYHSSDFLPGVYALGDLLKDNGYYNEYISAARTSFGGLQDYFTNHGEYNIIDSKNQGKYTSNYSIKNTSKWGINDNYLFEIARKRLEEISNNDEPFNLVLQTIDTHYIDGYIGWYSLKKYDTQYENVYATESKLIYDFIMWIKDQDFYENTTVMIVGDHISMQADFFEKRGASISQRYIYNCYINPINKVDDTSNRIYSAVDTYPTVLSSIGVKIEGEKLGLGVNLFSSQKTLSEKYGFDKFNKELNKKSVFYNHNILGSDYEKLKSKSKDGDSYDAKESYK